MLSAETRESLMQQLAQSNQALLNRLMQQREGARQFIQQDVIEDRNHKYRQQIDTDPVELYTTEKKQESWDDIVNQDVKGFISGSDLLAMNQDLNVQLQSNQEFHEQFDRTLKQIREESQPSQQIYSDFKEKEDETYRNHSDDEKNKGDAQERKNKYMRQIVKKYGHSTRNQSDPRRCHKHVHEREQFPFKPETHDLPRQIYGEDQAIELSKEAIWERLLQNKRTQLEKREQEKREKEYGQFNEQCPFKPKISTISQMLIECNQDQHEPVEQRLVREGMENKRRIEQMQREKFIQEQCTFQPKIENKLKGEKANQKPIHERIDDIIKRKQEQLLQLKLEQEKQEDKTFKPKISEKSNQIAESKLQSKSVIDRLMEDAMEKVKRRMVESQEHQKNLSEECTFIPSINPQLSMEDKEFNQLAQQEFVQKQYLMADYLREKKEQLLQEFIKQQHYTFKPEVNKLSALLVEADPDRQAEDLDQKVKRLSQKDHEKKILVQEQLQEAYYKQFSFKPQINAISSMIGRKRSLESLAYNKEGQERLKHLREEAEQEQRQECSFQPQVNKNQPHVRSKYEKQKIKENLEMEEQQRKRKVQELQRKQEYEELKECTFKPQTNQAVRISQDSIVEKVKGLDKFIQNKENHKKKIMEKQEREKEVFGWENKYDERRHQQETKPLPFNLSKGNPNGLRQLQEEIMQKEREKCTFQPKINQSQKRQFQELNYSEMMNQM